MTRFGKYEIVSELGRGTVGAVYRARDTMLEREVALKVLSEIHSGDVELKERFYREARACARLKHPGIVTVYDFGESDGVPYMVMELLNGRDLRALRSAGHTFAPAAALELMAQVLDALAHAHRAGIVHRDVKPSNIFVQEDSSAKVLDFGIARLPASELTRAGRALGTPDYMAPEQIAGGTCEARSDIFSAAIVAFELLAGSHPFSGDNIPRRIVQSAPQSLTSLRPDLPSSLEAALYRALARQPGERYGTADEFAAALRAIMCEVRAKPAGAAPVRIPESTFAGPLDATRILPITTAEIRREPAPAAFPPVTAGAAKPATEPPACVRAAHRPRAWLWVSAGALLVVVTAAALYLGSGRTLNIRRGTAAPVVAEPALEPPVATARVVVPRAAVLDAPDASGRRFALLASQTVAGITRLPLSVFQEWVAVQVRTDGARPITGFMRLADLGDWSSKDPGSALRLIEVFAPYNDESEAHAVEHIQKLSALLSSAGDAPEAARARLERGWLYLRLAGARKREGLPLERWRTDAENARADLSAATADPGLRPAVTRARAELASLLPAPAAETQTAERAGAQPAPARLRPAPRFYRADLGKVEDFWKNGLYAAAMHEVNLYIAQNPADQAGLAWRDRIAAAQRLEQNHGGR
jgi:predicted nucleic acid-binding protein